MGHTCKISPSPTFLMVIGCYHRRYDQPCVLNTRSPRPQIITHRIVITTSLTIYTSASPSSIKSHTPNHVIQPSNLSRSWINQYVPRFLLGYSTLGLTIDTLLEKKSTPMSSHISGKTSPPQTSMNSTMFHISFFQVKRSVRLPSHVDLVGKVEIKLKQQHVQVHMSSWME
jgi:hypothetical protein